MSVERDGPPKFWLVSPRVETGSGDKICWTVTGKDSVERSLVREIFCCIQRLAATLEVPALFFVQKTSQFFRRFSC